MTNQTSDPQFESQVRKLRENTSEPVESTDQLGGLLEKARRKAETPLRNSQEWDTPTERESPSTEYQSLMDFAQKAASRLEALDSDISALNEVEDEANREAYSSMLGITEGNNARRALESDERVVDKLRHEALEVSQDETVAKNINESVSNNIESLEESIDEITGDLNSSLSSYAEEFESYMSEMAAVARDEYGAMAQMTDYMQDLDDMDPDSELGEMALGYLKSEMAEILAVQTQNVSEIYGEMVKAAESTRNLKEKVDIGVRDRYDVDTGRLEDSIAHAEETLDNMAGKYDDFGERAEAMISESTQNLDSFSLSAAEIWDSEKEGKTA